MHCSVVTESEFSLPAPSGPDLGSASQRDQILLQSSDRDTGKLSSVLFTSCHHVVVVVVVVVVVCVSCVAFRV